MVAGRLFRSQKRPEWTPKFRPESGLERKGMTANHEKQCIPLPKPVLRHKWTTVQKILCQMPWSTCCQGKQMARQTSRRQQVLRWHVVCCLKQLSTDFADCLSHLFRINLSNEVRIEFKWVFFYFFQTPLLTTWATQVPRAVVPRELVWAIGWLYIDTK